MEDNVEAGDGKPSARADLVTGGLWVVVGMAITVGSWRMDRLASQGVEWFTAPGLLPGIVGIGIVLFALLIVIRALRAGGMAAPGGATDPSRNEIKLAAISLALCLAFAAVLVGHGLPFMAAAAIYLVTHIFVLQYPERRAKGQVARGAMVALVVGITAAVTISLVFQELFLVRLP